MDNNVLDKVFELSAYISNSGGNKPNIISNFSKDPWTTDYIPELFVSSEKLNIQIAQLVKILSQGKVITAICGDLKCGKSYIMNLLAQGLKDAIMTYGNRQKVFVRLLTPDDFKEYNLTALLQKIGMTTLGRYIPLKEQIIVELKKYSEEKNVFIVVLLDNFPAKILEKLTSDIAKIMKLLKHHFAAVIATHFKNIMLCEKGLRHCGIDHLAYIIHIPELTLAQAKMLILRRLQYGLETKNIRISDIFSERAIEAAWVVSNGNPWVLISILADAFMLAKKYKRRMITIDEINEAASLFARVPTQTFQEEGDKFIIQQALNNFPFRERQVCELLMQKDATAKEITYHIYGNLNADEYRSKYMGIKSFLKRLKEKNVVIIKGWKGRSIVFGLNPKMKEQLVQYEPSLSNISEYEKMMT